MPVSKVIVADKTENNEYEVYSVKVSKIQPKGFTIQIASYKELTNLLRIADDIKNVTDSEIRVQVINISGDKTYRLQCGNFLSCEVAEIS